MPQTGPLLYVEQQTETVLNVSNVAQGTAAAQEETPVFVHGLCSY